MMQPNPNYITFAQSTGGRAVEYTDCISTER